MRVVDHQVNEVGVIPIHGPVVDLRVLGFYLAARVVPLPGGKTARVDLRLGRIQDADPPERRRIHFGEIEFLSETREEVRSTLLCPLGKTVLAGILPPARSARAEGGAQPLACLIRIRALPLPPADPPVQDLHFLDAAVLGMPLPPLRLTRPGEPDTAVQGPSPLLRAGVVLGEYLQRAEDAGLKGRHALLTD